MEMRRIVFVRTSTETIFVPNIDSQEQECPQGLKPRSWRIQ